MECVGDGESSTKETSTRASSSTQMGKACDGPGYSGGKLELFLCQLLMNSAGKEEYGTWIKLGNIIARSPPQQAVDRLELFLEISIDAADPWDISGTWELECNNVERSPKAHTLEKHSQERRLPRTGTFLRFPSRRPRGSLRFTHRCIDEDTPGGDDEVVQYDNDMDGHLIGEDDQISLRVTLQRDGYRWSGKDHADAV